MTGTLGADPGGSAPPTGRLRAALVLHGKLGSIDRGQGWSRAVDGAAPSLDLVAISYATMARHILQANRDQFTVDVFGHSWSPDLGPAIDALFQPKRSVHQREETHRNRMLCTTIGQQLRQVTASVGIAQFAHYGAVGRGANSCTSDLQLPSYPGPVHLSAQSASVRTRNSACSPCAYSAGCTGERTASHLLGMQRAIQLKASHEKAHGMTYDVIMVSRWDVIWNRPLLLSRIDVSRGGFVLPQYCTSSRGVDHKSEDEKAAVTFRKAVCGGPSSAGQVCTSLCSWLLLASIPPLPGWIRA